LEKLKWRALSLIEDQIIKEACNSSENESKIEKIKLKLWQSWQGVCRYFDESIGFLRYRPDNYRLIVTIISA
jgi:mRNA-degrading endonuclease RelE of RelBE toxin-antitoxin system